MYSSVVNVKNQVKIENIPQDLKDQPNWVVWKYEIRAGDPKPTKPPYQINGKPAKSNDSTTWNCFNNIKNYDTTKWAGIGFMLNPSIFPLTGIDLDKCINSVTGEMAQWAVDIVDRLGSYSEISPSGTGVRIFVKGLKPQGRCRTSSGNAIEIYSDIRFLTLTGNHISYSPLEIEYRQEELNLLHAEIFPNNSNSEKNTILNLEEEVKYEYPSFSQIIDKALSSTNGEEFKKLWFRTGDGTDESSMDAALCSRIAFWAENNPSKVKDIFLKSPYFNSKTESHQEKWIVRKDYSKRTIGLSVSGKEFYNWHKEEEKPMFEVYQDDKKLNVIGTEEKTKTKNRSFKTISEIRAMPQPKWLIKNWIPENNTGCIYGASGCKKSFVALEMSLDSVYNKKFFGSEIRPCKIAYIYSEAIEGCAGRIDAWKKENNVKEDSNDILFSENTWDLTDEEETVDLKNLIMEYFKNISPDIIFIDTLSKNFKGSQNDDEDMGKFVNNIEWLRKEMKCTVIAVHHTGKDDTKEERGSSSLRGGVGFSIKVYEDSGYIIVENKKMKDSADGGKLILKEKIIELGVDPGNEWFSPSPITSLVLEQVSEQEMINKKEINKIINNQLYLSEFLENGESLSLTRETFNDRVQKAEKNRNKDHKPIGINKLREILDEFVCDEFILKSRAKVNDPYLFKITEKGMEFLNYRFEVPSSS